MNLNEVSKLNELYSLYGYEPKKIKNSFVYLFTKGIYNGVDILKLGNTEEEQNLKTEFTKSEYAVKLRSFKDIEEAEDALFKDFFKSEGVASNLAKRYTHFVQKMMNNLPEKAEYEYIKCPFELTQFEFSAHDFKRESFDANDDKNSLVEKVVDKINNHNGPLLIIIEAAAGYGKTCTAYEILRKFVTNPGAKLPFFTELSRDRSARIFKHILQFEIEEQFANTVDSKLVIHQIKKGRIPLIIDGFDELISKDFSFNSSQFEQVESMLSTIVDLLQENAKIIITSRKTAIFNGEEFHDWMTERNIEYSLQRITISEPKIENWLTKEKIGLLTSRSFPIEQIANPVLLTYLRYISPAELQSMIVGNDSIVNRYFDFLLRREQTRQNLLIEPETQMRIFRKMVRLFTEWDIKSETKEFIKDLLLDYNKKIIEETRQKYTPDKRPRVDQLADILSNHAFLDRKESGKIGIVNEFVMGTLIGENLILDKFYEYNPLFYENFSQMFAILAVQAFQVQSQENKQKLWKVFNSFNFTFEPNFYFLVDVSFVKKISRKYKFATLKDYKLEDFLFNDETMFESTIFMNCFFINCSFTYTAFKNSSFVNCKFYGCVMEPCNVSAKEDCFVVYGCEDDNGFINHVYEHDLVEKNEEVDIEKEILELFFKKGSYKPRFRNLSKLKNELSDFNTKYVNKTIQKLEREGILQLNGDLCFVTKQGITYFIDKVRNH